MIEPKVGQVWRDRDPRHPDRRLIVEAVDARFVQVRRLDSDHRTRIARDRMRPIGKTKGYELVISGG